MIIDNYNIDDNNVVNASQTLAGSRVTLWVVVALSLKYFRLLVGLNVIKG